MISMLKSPYVFPTVQVGAKVYLVKCWKLPKAAESGGGTGQKGIALCLHFLPPHTSWWAAADSWGLMVGKTQKTKKKNNVRAKARGCSAKGAAGGVQRGVTQFAVWEI